MLRVSLAQGFPNMAGALLVLSPPREMIYIYFSNIHVLIILKWSFWKAKAKRGFLHQH